MGYLSLVPGGGDRQSFLMAMACGDSTRACMARPPHVDARLAFWRTSKATELANILPGGFVAQSLPRLMRALEEMRVFVRGSFTWEVRLLREGRPPHLHMPLMVDGQQRMVKAVGRRHMLLAATQRALADESGKVQGVTQQFAWKDSAGRNVFWSTMYRARVEDAHVCPCLFLLLKRTTVDEGHMDVEVCDEDVVVVEGSGATAAQGEAGVQVRPAEDVSTAQLAAVEHLAGPGVAEEDEARLGDHALQGMRDMARRWGHHAGYEDAVLYALGAAHVYNVFGGCVEDTARHMNVVSRLSHNVQVRVPIPS
jgi:hypothetical protein